MFGAHHRPLIVLSLYSRCLEKLAIEQLVATTDLLSHTPIEVNARDGRGYNSMNLQSFPCVSLSALVLDAVNKDRPLVAFFLHAQ